MPGRTEPDHAALASTDSEPSKLVMRVRFPSLRTVAAHRRCAGPFCGGLRLVLVALLVLVLPDVLLRGIHRPVGLLMIGVTIGEPRYFVDPLSACSRCTSAWALRLLLQVAEIAHAILLCLTEPGLSRGRVPCAPTQAPGTDAQAPSGEDPGCSP